MKIWASGFNLEDESCCERTKSRLMDMSFSPQKGDLETWVGGKANKVVGVCTLPNSFIYATISSVYGSGSHIMAWPDFPNLQHLPDLLKALLFITLDYPLRRTETDLASVGFSSSRRHPVLDRIVIGRIAWAATGWGDHRLKKIPIPTVNSAAGFETVETTHSRDPRRRQLYRPKNRVTPCPVLPWTICLCAYGSAPDFASRITL